MLDFNFREDLVQANKRISSSLRAGIRTIEKVRPKKGRKEKKKKREEGERRKEGRKEERREEKRRGGGERRGGKGKEK